MFLSDIDQLESYILSLSHLSYLPISILPVMSEIFERHVHLVLHEYLNQLGLLFKYQSGFRLFYSCVVDRLLMNMDNGL